MNAVPARDAAPRARSAALRALEIDPSLAEAHAVVGKVKELYDFDWAGATKDFDRAIELNPGYATARQWRAENFLLRGHVDEALAEIRRAEALDPLSLMINAVHGWLLLQAHRYDEGIEQLRQTIALDPSFAYAHFVCGRTYLAKRMYPEAMAEFQAGTEIGSVSGRGLVYAVTGREAEARGVLNDLLARTKTSYVPAPMFAALYMTLGEKDRAFEWLGKGLDERGENIVWLATDPLYDPLRSDPRFRDALRRLNLAP
jgi:tetratricopeptide (TPR) repeat protein